MLISNAPEVRKLACTLLPIIQIPIPYINFDSCIFLTSSGIGRPRDANIESPKRIRASKEYYTIMHIVEYSLFSSDTGYSSPVTRTFSGETRSSHYLSCTKLPLYPHDMQNCTLTFLNWLRSVFAALSFTIPASATNSLVSSNIACPSCVCWFYWLADTSFGSPLNHML